MFEISKLGSCIVLLALVSSHAFLLEDFLAVVKLLYHGSFDYIGS